MIFYSREQRLPERRKREEVEEQKKQPSRKGLSDSQRDRFEDMLRNLYPDRNPLAEAMVC